MDTKMTSLFLWILVPIKIPEHLLVPTNLRKSKLCTETALGRSETNGGTRPVVQPFSFTLGTL